MEKEKSETAIIAEALQQILAEIRRPREAQDAKQKRLKELRVQIAEEQRALRAAKAERQKRCSHLRPDKTSCIAWMMNSDGITRGVCMHCDRLITPDDPDYKALRAINVFDQLGGIMDSEGRFSNR